MKDIKGYNGMYRINESGIVINRKGHVLRPGLSKSGYLRVSLLNPDYKDKDDRKNKSVHRLVAENFLENDDPENKTVVMHLDNDTMNNHVSNLKWGTPSENMQQAVRDKRLFGPCSYFVKEYEYEIYDNKGHSVKVYGRPNVADTICYSEISLKNMVGNGHIIDQGPYTGYQIRRTGNSKTLQNALVFIK
jgi:hypothetical protein